ncbi:MAG: hypothetical protein KC621_04850 [Myxococcales bacterium]|nr:hypothetical protein [Myxococcales bacterium]
MEQHLRVVVRAPSHGLSVLPRQSVFDPWSLPEADDPALAEVLVLREEALAAWEEEVAEAQADLPPGEAMAPTELAQPPDLNTALARLDQVGDAGRIDAFGRLLRADAALAAHEAGVETERSTADIVRTADPDLASVAAVLLAHTVRRRALDRGVLEALEALADEVELDPDVVSFGLDQALRFHPEHVATWTEQLQRVVDACDPDASRCMGDRAALLDAQAAAGEAGAADAEDWQEAARIAAFRCREAGGPLARAVTASWDGGWRFDGWAPADGAFQDCFEDELATGPRPDDAIVVSIEILEDPG